MFDHLWPSSTTGRFSLILDRVRTHDWIVPTTLVGCAVVLAFVMEEVDRAVQGHLEPVWWLFSGEQKIARQLLSAIAAAMVAIVTMAFSITVTALAFVAQHYGAQAIRTFMRNLTMQIVIGGFLATFVYALLVLRSVHGVQAEQEIPRIAVTLSIVLALVSFGLLVYFLYHISERMDAPNVVEAIAHDLGRVISRATSPNGAPSSGDGAPDLDASGWQDISAHRSGYLQAIDADALVKIARMENAVIRLHCRIGRFIMTEDRLATISTGPASRDRQVDVRKALVIGNKRTLEQDVEFGIDQLVQVAIRGLSPGRNDTFTTMLCLDRLGAALSRLAGRRFPPSIHREDDGRIRLLMQPPTFPDMVDRAFEQIHSFGGETTVVGVRLLRTIRTIASHVERAEDREVLRRHAVEVHRSSQARLKDQIGMDAIEQAFHDVVTMLGRSVADEEAGKV